MRDEKGAAGEPSLDDILADFDPTDTPAKTTLTGGTTITIWVTPEDKERYNRIQQRTRRRFGKKARELLLAALEIAEGRAS